MSEELRALDADHFYIGDFLVDLVALQYDELMASRNKCISDWNIHEIGVSLSTLRNYAKRLAKGEQIEAWKVIQPLKRLNHLGLHTGYPPWKPNGN